MIMRRNRSRRRRRRRRRGRSRRRTRRRRRSRSRKRRRRRRWLQIEAAALLHISASTYFLSSAETITHLREKQYRSQCLVNLL